MEEVIGNKIVIKPSLEEMSKISENLRKRLSEWEISKEKINKLQIVLDEILSNIINYSGADFIEFGCHMSEGEVVLSFVDNGMKFNPLEMEEVDIDSPIEEREFGGLGIYIVKNSVDKIEYDYKDCKNILTVHMIIV